MSFEDESEAFIGYLDIDNFGEINNNQGHHIADQIADEIYQLGKENENEFCEFNRVYEHGDEFIFVFRNCEKEDAEKLMSSFREKVEDENPEGIEITISGGIAAYPSDGSTKDEVIRLAEEAMKRSKEFGGNEINVYGDYETLKTVKVTYPENLNVRKGNTIRVEAWRNENIPEISKIRAVEIKDETDGISYSGGRATTSNRTIEDEPLIGVVSDIDMSSAETELKVRFKKSRIDELPDDRDFYKSGLVP